MDSNAWLKELKEGDKVFIDNNLTTVARITPKGRIKVYDTARNHEGEMLDFGTQGARTEGSGWHVSYYHLIQYTPEREQAINDRREHSRLFSAMVNAKAKDITLDQLRRIDAILREGKPAPEGGKHG